MKNLLWLVNLLLLGLVHSAYADDADRDRDRPPRMEDSNMTTINFSDLKNTDGVNKNIAAFAASLDISETQSVSSGGISFELSLQYEGTKGIAVHNPIYFVQYTLKGSDKAQLFNGGKPSIPLINRKGPIDETSDFNFNVLKIEKNGRNLNIREQANMPTIQFQRGDKLSYYLQISQYLNQQTRQYEDLPEGVYRLELLFSIIEADTTEGSPQSRTLKVADVSVSFIK